MANHLGDLNMNLPFSLAKLIPFKAFFFRISKQYGKPFRGSQYESTLLSGHVDSFQNLIQPTAKFQF